MYLISDNIFYKSMSIKEANKQIENVVEETNKRQIIDESSEIVAKAPKLDIIQKKNNVKRKMFVMLLGYLGKNYSGMQINRGIKTVEGSLLSALLKADFITNDQFEDLKEIRFQRAARTDKGVSAVRQIVSLQLRKYYIISLFHYLFLNSYIINDNNIIFLNN